ncbi:hypothetical protein PTSG_06466 [Salpingoeca rosetta]|uniref:Small ribosomal subunit protein uS10m n=1 Tax=Salpingoeca rosetta (strain ATCC 50818 / BSB-021) TaxID=946362 RepID=F2UFW1_SALR5|nr:uncharacterized protein PTSG_06466 [Salpingoeca rosetta]EGD75389.1 hypothetical protein PTSG_06466 [Salpingoeca rosetta]|eukprot:XP_004991846.1 hypothetical protein PTSG_06466 [Salpingoeca rosetta]
MRQVARRWCWSVGAAARAAPTVTAQQAKQGAKRAVSITTTTTTTTTTGVAAASTVGQMRVFDARHVRAHQQQLGAQMRCMHVAAAALARGAAAPSAEPATSTANATTAKPKITTYDIRTHSESGLFHSVTIKGESWNYANLDSFFGFIERAADELNIQRGGTVKLPTHRKEYTVLSSPHVYKQHRSQYVLKTHKRCIKIKNVTEETAASFVEYIMTNAPPGVASRVIMRAAASMPRAATTTNTRTRAARAQ